MLLRIKNKMAYEDDRAKSLLMPSLFCTFSHSKPSVKYVFGKFSCYFSISPKLHLFLASNIMSICFAQSSIVIVIWPLAILSGIFKTTLPKRSIPSSFCYFQIVFSNAHFSFQNFTIWNISQDYRPLFDNFPISAITELFSVIESLLSVPNSILQ